MGWQNDTRHILPRNPGNFTRCRKKTKKKALSTCYARSGVLRSLPDVDQCVRTAFPCRPPCQEFGEEVWYVRSDMLAERRFFLTNITLHIFNFVLYCREYTYLLTDCRTEGRRGQRRRPGRVFHTPAKKRRSGGGGGGDGT